MRLIKAFTLLLLMIKKEIPTAKKSLNNKTLLSFHMLARCYSRAFFIFIGIVSILQLGLPLRHVEQY